MCVATALMPQVSILLVICSNNNNYYCLSASFQMTRHTIATCIHFLSDISDTPLSKYITTWPWMETSCKSWINISGFSLKIGVAGEYYKVKSNRWITTEGQRFLGKQPKFSCRILCSLRSILPSLMPNGGPAFTLIILTSTICHKPSQIICDGKKIYYLAVCGSTPLSLSLYLSVFMSSKLPM